MGSLLTGVGYIGARLAELLLDSGETVVAVDNLFSTDPAAVRRLQGRQGFALILGDVADENVVRQAFQTGVRIDTVYHLAAQASANPAAAPTRYTEVSNLVGPRVVMDQACVAGASTFLFGSSLQVYGRQVSGLIAESHPYGQVLDITHLSKVYVEKLMDMYACTRGLRCVAARLGLVYGLGPVMKSDPLFMTAPNKFCRQVALGDAMRVDSGALHPTGMIHVDDAARGLIALARWKREGFTAANLIAETVSVARVASMVRDLAEQRGMNPRLIAPEGLPRDGSCTFVSALNETGFAPQVRLEEGLPPVLEHFAAQGGPA